MNDTQNRPVIAASQERPLWRGTLRAVAFHTSGDALLVGGSAGIHLLDSAGRAVPRLLRLPDARDGVAVLAASRCGRYLAAGTYGGTILLWHTNALASPQILGTHKAEVTAVSFSASGDLLLTTSADRTACLWEVASAEIRHTIKYGKKVAVGALSPDGALIIASPLGREIHLHSANSGELLGTLSGHRGTVVSLAVSEDGRTLISGALDRTARIWDLDERALRSTLGHKGEAVMAVALSPDGKLAATHDGQLHFWAMDATPVRTLERADAEVVGLVFDQSGSRVACAGCEHGRVDLFEVSTGALLSSHEGWNHSLVAAALSPNAATAVIESESDEGQQSRRKVQLFDAVSGLPIAILADGAPTWPGPRSFFSPSGAAVGTWLDRKTLAVYQCSDGAQLAKLTVPEPTGETPPACALSPDGKRLATASGAGQVDVYELPTGTRLAQFHAQPGSLCFSADGEQIFIAGQPGSKVVSLRISDGAQLALLPASGAFDPQAQVAVTANEAQLELHSLKSGQLLARIAAEVALTMPLALSPQGSRLAAVRSDGTVCIWTLPDGTLVSTLPAEFARPTALAFDAAGQHLSVLSRAGWLRRLGP